MFSSTHFVMRGKTIANKTISTTWLLLCIMSQVVACCVPGERTFYRVKVPNAPVSWKR